MLDSAEKWDFEVGDSEGGSKVEGGTKGRPLRVCVVGGGAGGIGLCLSMQNRLVQELRRRGLSEPERCVDMTLFCRSKVGRPGASLFARPTPHAPLEKLPPPLSLTQPCPLFFSLLIK